MSLRHFGSFAEKGHLERIYNVIKPEKLREGGNGAQLVRMRWSNPIIELQTKLVIAFAAGSASGGGRHSNIQLFSWRAKNNCVWEKFIQPRVDEGGGVVWWGWWDTSVRYALVGNRWNGRCRGTSAGGWDPGIHCRLSQGSSVSR